ncbi:CBS and ACT domain-containing protein [Streptococcus cuniculipharyngis]|uniref:CBS domain-containing protein n=1 Tax=Streptococcus cuniculipharyngis TaxID=1562651 RepID=A0A5C5S9H4_9STRE|nr:CBS and ACT domain-containing protein [Streptococcus cuniculipharyngis]TWS96645.1 CBS domain-containing protein [Streptococcus cuniculipharyngis]
MAVKDFMTKKVVYISPDTSVAHAADLMKEQGLRRLPVIENDRLIGLVTAGTMAEATPSKATSLSIYEMNYLLNKTKVREVMIKDVITISPYANLEDAIYVMMTNKIGVLPVAENGVMSGIITDRDVFRTFLKVSGYGEEGIRVRLFLKDEAGAFEKVVKIFADDQVNIRSVVVNKENDDKVVVEVQLEGGLNIDDLQAHLQEQGVHVDSISQTQVKVL